MHLVSMFRSIHWNSVVSTAWIIVDDCIGRKALLPGEIRFKSYSILPLVISFLRYRYSL